MVHEPTDAERLAALRLGAEGVDEDPGATARPESVGRCARSLLHVTTRAGLQDALACE